MTQGVENKIYLMENIKLRRSATNILYEESTVAPLTFLHHF